MIVTIARNPMGSMTDPTDYQTFENVEDLCALLYKEFNGVWPATAKVYVGSVSDDCDVTPRVHVPGSIERLNTLTGHVFVIVYPEGPLLIIAIIAIVLAVAAIALTFLFRPSQKTQQQQSPNNALSNRENTDRPNERIPDIVGTVRATPDLITPPYRVFESQQEVEYCMMCIGRKSFKFYQTTQDASGVTLAVPVWDIKDDLTPLQEEAGASCEVWAPYTSPNAYNGSTQVYTPQIRLGDTINEPAWIVQASTSITGQILRPPNDASLYTNYSASYAGVVTLNNTTSTTQDLTDYFAVGDMVHWDCNPATDPGGAHPGLDLSGTYECLAVTANDITFANPAAVNPNWNSLVNFTGEASAFVGCTLSSTGSKWVGPFVLNVGTMTQVWINLVAPQGLYKVSSSSGNQYYIECDVLVGIQAVDGSLQPVGAEVFYSGVLHGSATKQSQRGVTLMITPPLPGPCQVRICRTNFTDNSWQGTNADQTQWRDMYAVSPPNVDNYGNVTTVQTKTYATASALTSKSRKLNMLVTAQQVILDPVTHLPATPFQLEFIISSLALNVGQAFDFGVNATGVGAQKLNGTLTITIPGSVSNSNQSPYVESVVNGDNGNIIGGGAYSPNNVGPVECTMTYTGDANYPAITLSLTLNVYPAGTNITMTPGSSLSSNATALLATDNAADIIIAIALDPFIGDRVTSEIDFDGIYAGLGVAGDISTYFGTPLCSQFGYTFDDTNTSFEEMLSDIQQATFCNIFRRGSVLSLNPELPTNTSTLLFNHRNKLPGSETRTVSFGYTNDYDGIELDYVDPNYPNYPDADTPTTLYFPPDQSAVNAKKVTAVGVRNNVQAYILGWRLYNKLRYQHEQTEFTALKEATMCVLNDRILVADNTRDDVIDGDVQAINGLQLTLSQPVTLTAGLNYSIYLQNKSGTVASIGITQPAGYANNQVLLAQAPPEALSVDRANWAQTTYMIALPPDAGLGAGQIPAAMLLAEKTSKDKQQFGIKAINYDGRYYKNDGDFIAGLVTQNGVGAGAVVTGYPAPSGGGTAGGGGTGGNGTGGGGTEPGPEPIQTPRGDDPL